MYGGGGMGGGFHCGWEDEQYMVLYIIFPYIEEVGVYFLNKKAGFKAKRRGEGN